MGRKRERETPQGDLWGGSGRERETERETEREREMLLMLCCFTPMVNSYGHVGTVS